jgi:hypothetical protein
MLRVRALLLVLLAMALHLPADATLPSNLPSPAGPGASYAAGTRGPVPVVPSGSAEGLNEAPPALRVAAAASSTLVADHAVVATAAPIPASTEVDNSGWSSAEPPLLLVLAAAVLVVVFVSVRRRPER